MAFTADPLTGARDHVVITAASGLGERVVSGEATGDEWVVRDETATRRRSVESAIDSDQAEAIARLARAVEAHMHGVAQDIEWAIERGRLYLLQARPMTALPEAVDWTPPAPGYWLRTFRLGEWLSDAMTPLFRTWLLERLHEGFSSGMRETAGAAIEFPYAAIHGWYYTMAGFSPREIPRLLSRALIESRGRVLPVMFNAVLRVNTRPDLADRALLGGLLQHWHREVLPGYERVVADAERRVESASPSELLELIDAIGRCAGAYFWSLAIVGGSAWKMEAALTRFIRKHVAGDDGSDVQLLLRGLPAITLRTAHHAVQSIDWYWPPLGDSGIHGGAAPDRRATLIAEREATEARFRALFAEKPSVRRRFDSLLEVAQRYAAAREEQANGFTLGWPLMRRGVLRLGESLAHAGTIERAEDVFFLTQAEVLQTDTDLRDTVERRRAEWQRQRRLVAPLEIGKPPRLLEGALAGVSHSLSRQAAGRERHRRTTRQSWARDWSRARCRGTRRLRCVPGWRGARCPGDCTRVDAAVRARGSGCDRRGHPRRACVAGGAGVRHPVSSRHYRCDATSEHRRLRHRRRQRGHGRDRRRLIAWGARPPHRVSSAVSAIPAVPCRRGYLTTGCRGTNMSTCFNGFPSWTSRTSAAWSIRAPSIPRSGRSVTTWRSAAIC